MFFPLYSSVKKNNNKSLVFFKAIQIQNKQKIEIHVDNGWGLILNSSSKCTSLTIQFNFLFLFHSSVILHVIRH